MLDRPSDEDAKKQGFATGREWYVSSCAGTLSGERAERAGGDHDTLPKKDGENPAGPSAEVQWWSLLDDQHGCKAGEFADQDTSVANDPDFMLGDSDAVPYDQTFWVVERMRVTHPYLLSDVEPYNREWVASIRDDLSEAAHVLWKEESLGKAEEQEPLEFLTLRWKGTEVPTNDIRAQLMASQLRTGHVVLGSPP